MLCSLLLSGACLADGNLVLVIADDVGVDRVEAYGEHPSPPATPTLDRLAAEGLLFRNCWANPFCSPTRATILTGRHSFRTQVGWWVDESSQGLLAEEVTLPEVIDLGTDGAYHSALAGKWHLAGEGQSSLAPNEQGFEVYTGGLSNLGNHPSGYYDFGKTVNGVMVPVKRYATTDTVDDALRLVESFGEDPFLLVVAFHAAHVPYHRPPGSLHNQTLGGDPEDSPIPHHEAAVEAMDHELGRMLAGIPSAVMDRTTVVFVGDNGTQNSATEPPWPQGHGKGTVFEGGVRVPLIVAGRGVGVRGAECRALVNTVDLMPTLADLIGVDAAAHVPRPLDGMSLVPYLTEPALPSRREFIYAEKFRPNGPGPYDLSVRAARETRFKLVRNMLTGYEKLFDLEVDRFEGRNLLEFELGDEARAAWVRLGGYLDTIR